MRLMMLTVTFGLAALLRECGSGSDAAGGV